MKQCPINPDLECEECRMNFGPGKCGIFSLAADMSYLVELENYFTNILITESLTMKDKKEIDLRWADRVPEGTGTKTTARYIGGENNVQ